METKHEIVSTKFTTKAALDLKKHDQPRLAAKLECHGIKLAIFKGASSNLMVELAKVVMHHAR